MIFTKSSNKVISLLLAIALVLTMFVGIAPTNVLATGASGNVGESGTVGESGKILISLENVKTRPTEASGLEEKEGYEWFVVGQPIPTLSVSDFENFGEGSENVHIDRVEVDVWNGTSWITATGTVEADKLYRVSVVVLANDGYQLYLTSGPLDAGYNINYFYASVNENKEIVTIADNFFYRNTALCPKYEAGVTIPSISNKENEVIEIDDDVYSFPYSVREGKIKFMESTKVENDMRYWGDVTTSTFVQGKTYAMTFVLEPADGYTFNCGSNLGWVNDDGTFTIVWNLGVCPAKTTNALNGQLATTPAVTTVTDLTDGEQDAINNGATAKLDVSIKTATPPPADKTVADNKISEEKLTVAQYLDIDLNLVMGAYTRALTELKAPVTVQITVPAQFRGVNREFSIIRVHDGVAEKITPKSYNQYTGVLTFETDKFSTYALAYKDTTPTTTPVYGGGVAIIGTAGHIHNYKYSYDKDGHWQNCSCGAATSEQKHSLNSSGVCVCGYDENSKTNTPVANPSTGASSLTFIFVVLSVLALYGTTAIYSSRKKHSR